MPLTSRLIVAVAVACLTACQGPEGSGTGGGSNATGGGSNATGGGSSTTGGGSNATGGGSNATGGGSSATGGGEGTSEPSAATSTLAVDRTDAITADGVDAVTITITLKAADGSPVPGVTVGATASGSDNVFSAFSVTDAAGVSTAQLASTRAEPKTLTGTFTTAAGSVTLAQQPTVTFSAGAAAQLSFQVSPGDALAGAPLSPAPVVAVTDAQGNPVADATSITVSLSGGAALTGAASAATTGGLATFAGLSVERAGTGYTLTASAGGATDATSAAFDITASEPAAATSTLTAAPQMLFANGLASTALTVTVRDAFQNPVPGVEVVLAADAPDGGVGLTQPLTPTDDAGVTAGSATCSLPQGVSFTALLADGGLLAGPALVAFTECAPSVTGSCYSGPLGTAGIGPCSVGQRTCDSTGTWGPCVGEVLPTAEVCANGIDEDCSGLPDDVPDLDVDGWTACDGDCCETTAGCSVPTAVNPGAVEALGNGVDDDCDPATSDTVAPAACSSAAKFSSVGGVAVAKAMDLCQTTTANPPLANRKWGLISATQLLANGSAPNTTDLGNIQNSQSVVFTGFGTSGGNVPRSGVTMASLSTGAARDENDPGYLAPATGSNFSRFIPFPGAGPLATYLAAHGGVLVAGSCAGTPCLSGTGAYDSIDLRLQLRVPTNAQGFSFDFRFFSSEYQASQCTAYNDSFLALLTSGASGIPADRQIAFDALGNPISVNSGFFQTCGGNGKNCGPCPLGTTDLAGTGFEVSNVGGATGWLTTTAPVVPGETITLDFLLFDVNDGMYDTTVLLDNFRWALTPVTLGTN